MRFTVALAAGAAWMGFSLWIALPWIDNLAAILGVPLAWLLIAGVALAPGFMNAFQVASLLRVAAVVPQGHAVLPRALTLLAIADVAASGAGIGRRLPVQADRLEGRDAL